MKEIRMKINQDAVEATDGKNTIRVLTNESFNEENATMYVLMKLYELTDIQKEEGDEVLKN